MSERFLKALELGFSENGGLQNGRVVDLRHRDDLEVFLIGDIHALHQRIDRIFEETDLSQKLLRRDAVVVFLGDLHHREEDRAAGEMISSLETFEKVADLKCRYPQNFYVLLGNHEFTQTGSTKRGYYQGDLFREALVEKSLWEIYCRFVEYAPLVAVHRFFVAAHAGPAITLGSFEELSGLSVANVVPAELPPAVRELCFSRHVDWSANPSKHYHDHHVKDFLNLCDVPQARFITGHTPLSRETDWCWKVGEFLTVIFAAGRELGVYRVRGEVEEFVRLGRFFGDRFVKDRSALFKPSEVGLEWAQEDGCRVVRLEPSEVERPLPPDVEFRFRYAESAITLESESTGKLQICHYRHLAAWSQSYYSMGYFLVGDERRQEVLKLKTDLAYLLGGPVLIEGVCFTWGEEEVAVLRRIEDDLFSLRALRPGLRLSL